MTTINEGRIEPLATMMDENAKWEVAKLRVQAPRKGEHWLMTATTRMIMGRAAMDVLKFALLIAAAFIVGCLTIPVVLP